MKIIYLSGPMTGHPDFNRAEFHRVAELLRKDNPDVTILNPGNIRLEGEDQTWQKYMREAITIMMAADSVLMLKGWENSVGARIERQLALDLGIDVEYQK